MTLLVLCAPAYLGMQKQASKMYAVPTPTHKDACRIKWLAELQACKAAGTLHMASCSQVLPQSELQSFCSLLMLVFGPEEAVL